MFQPKAYRHDRERVVADDTDEWFATRDWLAAGEKLKIRPESTSPRLRHFPVDYRLTKPKVVMAASRV